MSGIGTFILIAAVMAAVLGGISLLAHIYNLNSIKSKTVGDGQHGTARWATKSEIRSMYRYVPFTPKKWRKQAENGQTPTAPNGETLPQGITEGLLFPARLSEDFCRLISVPTRGQWW